MTFREQAEILQGSRHKVRVHSWADVVTVGSGGGGGCQRDEPSSQESTGSRAEDEPKTPSTRGRLQFSNRG
jgi:hypothetical protein